MFIQPEAAIYDNFVFTKNDLGGKDAAAKWYHTQ